MRVKHTLLLAAGATVAVVAMTPSALAQTMEVTNEATGQHCAAVTIGGTDVNGGCLIHATSEGSIELRKHVFGVEAHITSCTNEFASRISEDAAGYIFEQVLAGASCSRRACIASGSEPTPWTASEAEGAALEGTEFLTTSFCVEPVAGGTDETCEIDVPFQSYSNQHRQEYGHVTEMSSHGISGFRCELVGHWNSETGGVHDGDAEQELGTASVGAVQVFGETTAGTGCPPVSPTGTSREAA